MVGCPVTGGGRRRVTVVLLAVAGPLAGALAAVAVVVWLAYQAGPGTTDVGPAARVVSSQTPQPTSKALPQEVNRLHQALHSIAHECQKQEPARSFPRIDRDVDIILSFARRYPEGRFAIDGETGSALSLLLATHDDLRTCAPKAAGRLNRALPVEFRQR